MPAPATYMAAPARTGGILSMPAMYVQSPTTMSLWVNESPLASIPSVGSVAEASSVVMSQQFATDIVQPGSFVAIAQSGASFVTPAGAAVTSSTVAEAVLAPPMISSKTQKGSKKKNSEKGSKEGKDGKKAKKACLCF